MLFGASVRTPTVVGPTGVSLWVWCLVGVRMHQQRRRRSGGCLVAGQSGNPKAQISVWVNCCAPSALGG